VARTTGDHNGNGFQDIGGHDDASADSLRWFGGSGVVLRSGTVSDTVRAVGDWSEAEMRTITNFASGSYWGIPR
jgi:hypothetical protein